MPWWNDALGQRIGQHLTGHWCDSGLRDTVLFPGACDRMHKRRMPTGCIESSSSQTIAQSGSDTQVLLPNETWASRGTHPTANQIDFTKDGLWLIFAEVHWALGHNQQLHVSIYHGPTGPVHHDMSHAAGSKDHAGELLTSICEGAVDDWVKLYVHLGSGSDQDVETARLTALWIRPLV